MKTTTINTVWRMKTYDVWGNAKDGFDVNDVYGRGTVELELTVETANAGQPFAFVHASPTDKQIREVFGIGRTQIETSGDDMTIYVNRKRDGYPLGELSCESHVSLSPIRELATVATAAA